MSDLQTVLSQIELILNSRPLGVLFDDDLEQNLTPKHLYIPSLREFQKAYHKSKNIPQVVILLTYSKINNRAKKWLLGRIIELISSKDNFVRAAKII